MNEILVWSTCEIILIKKT